MDVIKDAGASVVNGLLGESPPLVGYRFAAVLLTGLVPQIAPVDLRFKEISGLKVTRSLAGDQDWGLLKPTIQRRTLTFKRGMPNMPTPLQAVQLGEQAFWQERLLRTDILIATLSDTPIPYPTKAWLVPRAFLESIEWDGLNADTNGLMIESMSYSYSTLIPVPI